MRKVDIHQCDHKLARYPLFGLKWLGNYGSFCSLTPELTSNTTLFQPFNLYYKLITDEIMRKQEKS
ncbi:hypothetical protein [Alkalihalobacillus sp. BA299]|uniref:hypothetical protein n=1 Tax=Alkalihalobacillus sp. BA299 TaxID=2815938 RepID=UPI001ADC6FC3|nr:hypothetical protein [Alkalihalobacillus sp. BA299]